MARAFWMCFVEGQRAPEKRHVTRESANKEAERLFRHNQGQSQVLVMRCETLLVPRPEFDRIELDEREEIPF